MVKRWALVLLAACGSAPPANKPAPRRDVIQTIKPPEPNPQQKAAADAIARFYELFTFESAVPGDPKLLRETALEELAPKGWPGAPIAWTNDPHKDMALLRDAVKTLALRGELAADPVLRVARAMASATRDTHTFALSASALAGLFAVIGGGPVVQPGMLYHRLDDGRWAVSDIMPGSAAEAAGVQRGDILVSIGGSPIVQGFLDLAPLLGAPDGTVAELVVERGGKNQTILLRLVAVATPIVEFRTLAAGIGYIRVRACTHSDDATRDAAKLVAAALAKLDEQKVKKLVIDLRGNAGGFPFDVASLLVAADPLMLAINSDGVPTPVSRTSVKAWPTKRPIVVLVDEMTASGGEMVALALRDHAAARLVGRPTAGGLTFPTIEKHKAVPDVAVSYPLSRVGSAITKAVLDGNRLVPDIAAANASADDYAARRDPQLDAAVATLKTLR